MTTTLNNMPGGCCCGCIWQREFTRWEIDRGIWTLGCNAWTNSSDAKIHSKVQKVDLLLLSIEEITSRDGEWIRAGFQNDDASEMLYVRFRQLPGRIVEGKIVEEIAGSTAIRWTGSGDHFPFSRLPVYLLLDRTYNTFAINVASSLAWENGIWAKITPGSGVATVDRPFVATEAIAGQIRFNNVYYSYCLQSDPDYYVGRGPWEYDCTISGVSTYTDFNTDYTLRWWPSHHEQGPADPLRWIVGLSEYGSTFRLLIGAWGNAEYRVALEKLSGAGGWINWARWSYSETGAGSETDFRATGSKVLTYYDGHPSVADDFRSSTVEITPAP